MLKKKRLENFYCSKRRSLLIERDVSKDEVCLMMVASTPGRLLLQLLGFCF